MTHLHVRSWFSFLAGGSSPEAIVRQVALSGMKAVALTDRNGLYGCIRFQRICREAGIKPIVGAELQVEGMPLVLLAKTSAGYTNLCRILTSAHLGNPDDPDVSLCELAAYSNDLICLTGGREGRLYHLVSDRQIYMAHDWLARLQEIFNDRLFVELTHYFRPGDAGIVRRLHAIAKERSLPVVAANDARHATQRDYLRYDLLTCIRLGISVFDSHPERPVNAESYLKCERDMRRLIPFDEAFENTLIIADECTVELLPGHVTPPGARVPEGISPGALLASLCREGLAGRYAGGDLVRASEQLDKELSVISDLDLDEFFLVVKEIVDEARRRGIRCAGRGSAANSIAAYLLDITGVDPLRHRLLFERFLHQGRRGTPDIDVDFDTEKRDQVIGWMEDRFGVTQTAMTATVVTYGLRMALRETAKALGWDMETIDKLSSAVPPRSARSAGEFADRIREVVGESRLTETLLAMTASLHDCPRHLGLHSGGMVLCREPIYHFSPVQVSANGVKEVQFDKDDVEALGLVKLDILGLRMLSTISEAVELVEQQTGRRLDVDHLPLDDARTFDLICSGKTVGVFQIESQGQMHLLANNQPRCFDDLVAEVALFRPGPLQGNMVHPYVNRRRGAESVTYEHESLAPILEDTFGIILFQEQILEIAHTFAGMSLAEADRFRSLMSKNRDSMEMEAMREKFVGGAMSNGVTREIAESVFDKVSKFVGYGFCRSHAAAFAKHVYVSAYLKQHQPAAYMAAVMQHRPGMYNLTSLEQETRRCGVETLLPDINISGIRYSLEEIPAGLEEIPAGLEEIPAGLEDAHSRLAIRKPLTAIRELSADDARNIVRERGHGIFTSIEDLFRRVTLSHDVLDNIARSGALDRLAGSSRRALWQVGVLFRKLAAAGVPQPNSLFDLPVIDEALEIPDLPPLTRYERLNWDYYAQDSARVHPMTLLRRQLNDLEVRTIETCFRFSESTLRPVHNPTLTVGGIVIMRQMPPTAKGFMFVTLEDETGFVQCIISPRIRERLGPTISRPALVVKGGVQMTRNWRAVLVREAWELFGMIGGYAGHASAYGGMDRRVIAAEENMFAGLMEYLGFIDIDSFDLMIA